MADDDNVFAIDRCICANRTFAALKEVAAEAGCGVEELMKLTGAGGGCKMCIPYLRAMLATGQTVFRTPLLDEEAE